MADFGLSVTTETGSVEGSGDYKTRGTIRWMAPEIIDPERYGYVKHAQRKLPSKSTDIYAFGMTILEARPTSLLPLRHSNLPPQVITGRRPFERTNKDDVVVEKVIRGARPDRPTVGFSDNLWTLLTQTWLEEFESADSPSARPNIANILEKLQVEEKDWSLTSTQPTSPVHTPSCMSLISLRPTRV